MTEKRKPRFRRSRRDDAARRPASAGRDAEAMQGMRKLWTCIVLDVFHQDRVREVPARLKSCIEHANALDDSIFLKSCDALVDALNSTVFHGEIYGRASVAFGDKGIMGLIGKALEARAYVAPPIWGLATMAAQWAGTDLLLFIRSVYQIFAFPLRITLQTTAFDYDKLMGVNNTRDGLRPSKLLKRIAKRVITPQFVETVISEFAPCHGPGSVVYESGRSKRLSVHEKDDVLDLDLLNRLCLFAGIPRPGLLMDQVSSTQPKRKGPYASKCIDVPKSWKKRRLIAIEDVTLMYFAKGVQRGLYKAFEQDKFLSKIIDLRDAKGNSDLAQFASRMRTHATVDLSSASDSVGFKFVMELLQHNQRLCAILAQARPRELDVPGYGVVKNNIYATMGNACCFPVLTLVVTLILLEACFLSKTRRESLKVYGDDAVCPEQAANTFMELLKGYGFTVNTEKTFSGKAVPFRESCGGEYLNGYDITPLRISRKFEILDLGRGFVHVPELLSLANGCYARGFMRTYRSISAMLAKVGYLPLSRSGSIGLAHDDPSSCMGNYRRFQLPGDPSKWYSVHWLLMSGTPYKRGVIGLIEWLWRKEKKRESVETFRCIASYVEFVPGFISGAPQTERPASGFVPVMSVPDIVRCDRMNGLRCLDALNVDSRSVRLQYRRVHCLYNATDEVIVKLALKYKSREGKEEVEPLPIPINQWDEWLTPEISFCQQSPEN